MKTYWKFLALVGLVFGLGNTFGSAEAGLIRMAGSTTAVAPPGLGYAHLVPIPTSGTPAFGDPFPAAENGDHIFHNGLGPGIAADFAGSSSCNWYNQICWGEYVPNEAVFLEAAIWGGSNEAILTYEFRIKDDTNALLFSFDQSDVETATGPLYANGDAGNPCVGVNHYGSGSGNCQQFSVTFLIPDTIPFGEWLHVSVRATYTAPSGEIFVFSDDVGQTVTATLASMSGYTNDIRIKRVPLLPEAPTLALAIFGLCGLFNLKKRRNKE